MAQDMELGALPPIPDLDLGDPERKLSWKEKRQKSRKASQSRYENNVYERTAEDTGRATVYQRLSNSVKERTSTPRPTTEISVDNTISSSDNAMTASGARLQPFGEEGKYWEGIPLPPQDELEIDLLPMPDLRTPDQITKKERLRNKRIAKYELRKAEADAKREEREARERAVVNLPPADPANALVQVESQGGYDPGYMGNVDAPETINSGGNLKPFNEDSSYYKDGSLVYKGRKNTAPAQVWWKKGTSEPGDGVEPKWQWRNPFGGPRDDVQPVSYTEPADSGGYSASRSSLDSTMLTSNLRGIRIVRSTREVSKSGLGGVSGVVLEGVDLPNKVYPVFESRIGTSLTLGDLNQMVRDAVLAYRKSDLPVVDVLVPEQEITSGVLQLVIIEGRLGDVIVEGASRPESRALAGQIRTERGEVIRESQLTEDLAWINKHPTRQVDLIFSPGDGYGETDVILRSQAYKDLQAYFAYENSGTETLGEDRAIFGVSWTGPLFFGEGSILSYQLTTNFDKSDANIHGHSGVFATYLPWRHQLTLLGAYVDSKANFVNANGIPISTDGVNKQGSIRYGIPLPSIGNISHELELGMDIKSSSTDLDLNSAQVFDTISEIAQYSLGYNIIAKDTSGVWRVDSEVYSSPGDKTVLNTDAIFDSQRAGAKANYTYGRVSIERDQQLGDGGWTVFARMQGQVTNGNLLASETLGAGGYDTVRGFEQRVVRGDSGLVGSVELRTPTFYPAVFGGFDNVRDGAFGLLFYDAATLSSEDPLPGEIDRSLGSVGVGFRYQKSDWFTLRVDYGFQVSEQGFDDGEQGRWHVGARATF